MAATKASVLIVEDDQDLRNLYRMFLKGQGYDVQVAGDAEEAGQKMSEQKPQLVLLDLTLPTMSGADFLAQIRANPDYAGIKVIVSSGWDDLKQRAESMGADGFAQKPTNLAALSQKVAETLAG